MAMRAARITTTMIDPSALTASMRLAYWLSPAFPTGAFAYSHGLEFAFETGLIKTREGFKNWLRIVLEEGTGWSDAALCSLSWRADGDSAALQHLSDFGLSLAGSSERLKETTEQGTAFLKAASFWALQTHLPERTPLPICIGAATRDAGMDHVAVLSLYLSSTLTNLVQAALRMGRFGQDDGVAIAAALEPVIIAQAIKASTATLDDIYSATVIADLAAIEHETLPTRVFAT